MVPLVRSLGEGLPIPLGPGVTGRDEQGEIRDGGAGAAESIHALPLPSFAGMPTPEWIPILTSRGCIRDCSFCTEKFFWKRYRQRKVEDVLAEIEMRIAETGRRTFEFNDDLLNGHIRWLERFCDELIQRKLGIRWICFMEPYRLSRNLLERVAEAGCKLIKFGVQHLDRSMLKVIGRGDEVDDVIDTLVYAAELGIKVSFDIIPGHPGESEEQHSTNLAGLPRILTQSGNLEANINPFLLLHGSPVEQNPALRRRDFPMASNRFSRKSEGSYGAL